MLPLVSWLKRPSLKSIWLSVQVGPGAVRGDTKEHQENLHWSTAVASTT